MTACRVLFIMALALAAVLSGCGAGGSVGPADSGDGGTADIYTPRQPFDYCAADTPPDSECWAQKRSPESENIKLARSIADRQLARLNPADLKWDWGETVLMVGLVNLYNVTGDTRYRDFYRSWMDHHIEAGYEISWSDTCAPAAIAVELYRETGEAKYKAVVDDALDYLYNRTLRTREGAINHLGTSKLAGVAAWVDSLFMFGNVLTGWGESGSDKAALDEFSSQFSIFTKLLQKELGFYKHASDKTAFIQEDGVFWGRGNGWVAAAGFDHLRVRYNRGEDQAELLAALRRLIEAAKTYQDQDSGLYWTVINRPGETYLETSAAALFAFGMARGYRYGYLDDSILPFIGRSIAGIKARITAEKEPDPGPVVTGTSGPTDPGTFEYYKGIKQKDDMLYGIGAVIIALVESSGLPLP